MLSRQAEPIVADIEKKIASTEGPVHADETYWTLDGTQAYYWVHTTEDFVHFEFQTTRSGQVSRDILGEDFAGTLVTDCYSGYEAQHASAKQKCLAHLALTARDWQKLTDKRSADYKFFDRVVQWVKQSCNYHQKQGSWSASTRRRHRKWLERELELLQGLELKHEKAVTLQGRIIKHVGGREKVPRTLNVSPSMCAENDVEATAPQRLQKRQRLSDWRHRPPSRK